MRVPVYSIAKVFTAAAALRTFDSGTRIEGHLLQDLLAHRSGLDDYAGWPAYRSAVAAAEPAWPDEVVLEQAHHGEPGDFRYSNIGYLLVRRALEEAHGAPLLAVLRQLVLDEVGITAEPFAGAVGYDPRWVHPGTFVADLDEVAQGLAALLRTDTGRVMLETRPVDVPGHPFTRPGYGLGLMTDGLPPALAGHGGSGPGHTLVVMARADGSAAHAAHVPRETDDEPLVRACLDALR